MTPEQAQARIATQADDVHRRAAADVLLRNDVGLEELDVLVEALWRRRLRPYEENLRLRRPAATARSCPSVRRTEPGRRRRAG